MSIIALEQLLGREFAVERDDIRDHGTGAPEAISGAMAVRPQKVLELLGVTEEELFQLIRAGELKRPGHWGGGRVAWRWDDIEALVLRREALAD